MPRAPSITGRIANREPEFQDLMWGRPRYDRTAAVINTDYAAVEERIMEYALSQQFKEFDRRFKHLAGTALKTIESIGGKVAKEDIETCNHWPEDYKVRFTEDYSRSTIAYAVYEAPGAEAWQKFRVSLKGLSTKEKIFCLAWYWDTHIAPGAGAYSSAELWQHEIIRVNNYLGALKRGGQLDEDLVVQK